MTGLSVKGNKKAGRNDFFTYYGFTPPFRYERKRARTPRSLKFAAKPTKASFFNLHIFCPWRTLEKRTEKQIWCPAHAASRRRGQGPGGYAIPILTETMTRCGRIGVPRQMPEVAGSPLASGDFPHRCGDGFHGQVPR